MSEFGSCAFATADLNVVLQRSTDGGKTLGAAHRCQSRLPGQRRRHGWTTGPIRVSRQFGQRPVWPGDTFGITMLPRARPGMPGPPGVGVQRVSLT